MKNDRIVEWTLDDLTGELQRISLVSEPAIEQDFMLFSGQKVAKFKASDTEKRILTGIAMRPNINIPRLDENGEVYYGYFSEQTVEKAAQMFFQKASNTNNTNLEHQFEVDGVFVFESWLVEDPELDKSKALGFSDVKKGDWFVSMKVTNDKVWDYFVKTGAVKGFSVEIKVLSDDQLLSKVTEIINSSEDVDYIHSQLKQLLDI